MLSWIDRFSSQLHPGTYYRVTDKLHSAYEPLIDRYYGVETTRAVHRYAPTPWLAMRKLLSHIPIETSDVFLDVGSGKGRALLIASRFPFRKLIGVEISRHLAEVSKKNIRSFQGGVERFRIVRKNASEYEIPDEVTHLFMNDPFSEEVFEKVLRSTKRSLKRRPRTLYFIYVIPKQVDIFAKHFLFEEIALSHMHRSFYRAFKVDFIR